VSSSTSAGPQTARRRPQPGGLMAVAGRSAASLVVNDAPASPPPRSLISARKRHQRHPSDLCRGSLGGRRLCPGKGRWLGPAILRSFGRAHLQRKEPFCAALPSNEPTFRWSSTRGRGAGDRRRGSAVGRPCPPPPASCPLVSFREARLPSDHSIDTRAVGAVPELRMTWASMRPSHNFRCRGSHDRVRSKL
jgi:hypothetical protein